MRKLELQPVLLLVGINPEKKIYAFIKDGIIWKYESGLYAWSSSSRRAEVGEGFRRLIGGNAIKYLEESQPIQAAFKAGEEVYEFENQQEFIKWAMCNIVCQ